ncbi:MAG: hypothetical protein HYS25_13955 [Ignavibacteriales bacterium]|nr:hypothetical protein [Ignavibacteriales bacterium]
MKLINLGIISIAFSLPLSSCISFDSIGNAAVTVINKNDCGLLVFKDSTHYNLVYDFLEKKQEEFESSTTFSNYVDEEKPLTDFETSKNHESYRKLIITQEDIAENNGVDLSVNPVVEILEDDEILQTILNKDRMMVIENTVYFYYDDCTLFKFPAGKDCRKNINEALNYFKNLNSNAQNNIKPTFNFEKIDICDDEENYRAVQSNCQEIEIDFCASNVCHPEIVDFFMHFPGYYQTMYTLTDFKYQIDSNSAITLNINTATIINNGNKECGWSIGTKGFIVPINFPNTNTYYSIKMTGTFSYIEDSQTKYCTQEKTMDFFVSAPGCSIVVPTAFVNGLTVAIEGVNNPCNDPSIQDNFTFQAIDGAPTIISQSSNTIKLEYNCAGSKKIKISYNQDGCTESKEITVNPIDPSLCCTRIRTKCTQSYTSTNGDYKINVKLRERNNKLVAVVKNFKNGKRAKTNFDGTIKGPVYYNKNSCDCLGTFDFSKPKSAYRKKVRIKFKFRSKKNDIEQLDGIEHFTMPPISDFKWFKRNWSRKDTDPWKLNISTSQITTKVAKINCSTSNGYCDQ